MGALHGICHHLVKSVRRRYHSSGDLMFLVCQLIKQDMIEGSDEYNNENTLEVSHHTAMFGGHRHCSSSRMNGWNKWNEWNTYISQN